MDNKLANVLSHLGAGTRVLFFIALLFVVIMAIFALLLPGSAYIALFFILAVIFGCVALAAFTLYIFVWLINVLISLTK